MGFCCGSSSMKQRENTEHGANSWSKKYYGPWAQSVKWIDLGRKPYQLNMRNFGQKLNSCVGCNFDLLGLYMSLPGYFWLWKKWFWTVEEFLWAVGLFLSSLSGPLFRFQTREPPSALFIMDFTLAVYLFSTSIWISTVNAKISSWTKVLK